MGLDAEREENASCSVVVWDGGVVSGGGSGDDVSAGRTATSYHYPLAAAALGGDDFWS